MFGRAIAKLCEVMCQGFVLSAAESDAQCQRKTEVEREKYKANELKFQRGEFGSQKKTEPDDKEKSGSDGQHRQRRFQRHLSSHNHEEDDAELQCDDPS